jgi:hypothetical protein
MRQLGNQQADKYPERCYATRSHDARSVGSPDLLDWHARFVEQRAVGRRGWVVCENADSDSSFSAFQPLAAFVTAQFVSSHFSKKTTRYTNAE